MLDATRTSPFSRYLPLTLLAAVLVVRPLAAQSPAPPPRAAASDSAAIREAVRNYMEGWYTGDSARMARAVHPELAKRIVTRDAKGVYWLGQVGSTNMVRGTQAGYGTDVPPAQRRVDVQILDIYGDIASVRLLSTKLIDYLHLARWDGGWRIVNVLWDYRPEHRPRPRG